MLRVSTRCCRGKLLIPHTPSVGWTMHGRGGFPWEGEFPRFGKTVPKMKINTYESPDLSVA